MNEKFMWMTDRACREIDFRVINGGIHITPAFEKFAEYVLAECKMICTKNHRSDIYDDIHRNFYGVKNEDQSSTKL